MTRDQGQYPIEQRAKCVALQLLDTVPISFSRTLTNLISICFHEVYVACRFCQSSTKRLKCPAVGGWALITSSFKVAPKPGTRSPKLTRSRLFSILSPIKRIGMDSQAG